MIGFFLSSDKLTPTRSLTYGTEYPSATCYASSGICPVRDRFCYNLVSMLLCFHNLLLLYTTTYCLSIYLCTTDPALKHFLPIFYFISIFSRRFYAELNAHQVTCSVVDLAYNLTTWGILFHAFRASGRTSGIPVGLGPHMSLKNFCIFIIKYIFS